MGRKDGRLEIVHEEVRARPESHRHAAGLVGLASEWPGEVPEGPRRRDRERGQGDQERQPGPSGDRVDGLADPTNARTASGQEEGNVRAEPEGDLCEPRSGNVELE